MDMFEIYYEFYQNSIELNGKEAIDYFNDFFADEGHLELYRRHFVLSVDEKDAILTLFKKDGLFDRARNALEYDPCCFEAIMIISKYYEDEEDLYNFYEACFDRIIHAQYMSRHGKDNATLFCHIFADWLLAYGDLKASIKVQEAMFSFANAVDTTMVYRYINSLAQNGDFKKLLNTINKYKYIFNQLPICIEVMDILVNNGYEFEALDLLDIYQNQMAKANGPRQERALVTLERFPKLKTWIDANEKIVTYKA